MAFKLSILLTFICITAGSKAFANLTQEEAVYQASLVQKQGSDASLKQSTTSAMRGLMDLSEQKRASAIQHGYKAYGQFVNSEDMDYMNLKNQLTYYKLHTENILNSKAGSASRAPLEIVKTTYNRLDTQFLREGEAGKVADEFEKKSGMKRDQFLKIMARASESTISPSDPKLVDKVISRFEGFVKEIPNAEFRQGIEKSIQDVPASVRTGLISKGVQKIAEIMAKMPSEKGEIAIATSKPETIERKPATIPEEAPRVIIAAVEPLEHQTGVINMVPNESGYRGLEKEKFSGDVIGSVMQTALDEQKEETIFKQVSKRYRAMTPMLSLVRENSP